ncbi:hypothetical protein VTN31DRAFT_7092 [Thermomyces dupontii]|uniref:uncharacterized protein n=1 Tax=Talaromyces thermophilus TaxID=28565 RepID=UPI003742D2F3
MPINNDDQSSTISSLGSNQSTQLRRLRIRLQATSLQLLLLRIRLRLKNINNRMRLGQGRRAQENDEYEKEGDYHGKIYERIGIQPQSSAACNAHSLTGPIQNEKETTNMKSSPVCVAETMGTMHTAMKEPPNLLVLNFSSHLADPPTTTTAAARATVLSPFGTLKNTQKRSALSA